jgi:hypothetical protein
MRCYTRVVQTAARIPDRPVGDVKSATCEHSASRRRYACPCSPTNDALDRLIACGNVPRVLPASAALRVRHALQVGGAFRAPIQRRQFGHGTAMCLSRGSGSPRSAIPSFLDQFAFDLPPVYRAGSRSPGESHENS